MTIDPMRAASELERWLPAELRGAGEGRQMAVELHAGRRIAVHRWDVDGAAARLVLVHGAGANGLLLAPFGLAARRNGFAVTSFDLPGYGYSTQDPRPSICYLDFVDVATSVIATEAQRTGQPIVVAGFSIGGRLAVEAAGISGVPRHVIATNLLDPTVAEVRRVLTRWPWMAKLPDWTLSVGGSALAGIPVPMRLVANMAAVVNDPAIRRVMLADRTGAGAWMPRGFLHTLMTTSSVVRPEEFTTCPITLAQPGDDRWTPQRHSESFLARFRHVPTATVVLPNAGHAPFERPGLDVLNELTITTLQHAAVTAETDRR